MPKPVRYRYKAALQEIVAEIQDEIALEAHLTKGNASSSDISLRRTESYFRISRIAQREFGIRLDYQKH